MEALLAKGGPLEVPTVVDNEEEGAQDDDHSSDDDEEDGDGDEANATRDYYADLDPPPEETLLEAPKQSALLDLLAGKKPDDVLEDPGATQATNKTTNNPATGKGKGPSSVTSSKAPAPKAPNNPRVPGSTDTATTTLTPGCPRCNGTRSRYIIRCRRPGSCTHRGGTSSPEPGKLYQVTNRTSTAGGDNGSRFPGSQ